MRGIAVVVIAASLAGCSIGPKWKLMKPQKRTCAAEFLEWGGGLTFHVDQGPGDGTFAYDPPGDLITWVEGVYNLRNGDFVYTVTYADDSFRERDEVQGFGTLWTDGDMELEYTLTAHFADDSTASWEVHSQRYGCQEVSRIEDEDGRLEIVDGTWGSDAFSYVREWIWGPLVVEAKGSLEPDGDWEESASEKDGDLRLIYIDKGHADGRVRRDFKGFNGLVEVSGDGSVDRTGTVVMDYWSRSGEGEKAFWEYEVDAWGDGTGIWEQGDATCDLKFDDFSCKLRNCTDAEPGPCSPPAPFPVPSGHPLVR